MSPNMLSQIEQWVIDSKILNADQTNEFIDFLKVNKFKKDSFIYPGTIMRKADISTEKTYAILELLKEKGILKENYELYCHDCAKFHPGNYEYYSDIPDLVECEGCFATLNRANSVIVVYKVIEDDQ